MPFAHAGWCEACVARDLLFARAVHSGKIFFVCAACTAANDEPPTGDLSPHEQSISARHLRLAPDGWTLASRAEAEAAGHRVEADAPPNYEKLIDWYPGFHYRTA